MTVTIEQVKALMAESISLGDTRTSEVCELAITSLMFPLRAPRLSRGASRLSHYIIGPDAIAACAQAIARGSSSVDEKDLAAWETS